MSVVEVAGTPVDTRHWIGGQRVAGTQAVVASYSMVQIMADAITRAGSTDADKINAALGQTKDLPTVWAKITIGPDHRAVVPATAWRAK